MLHRVFQTVFGAWKKLWVCCLDFRAGRVQVRGVRRHYAHHMSYDIFFWREKPGTTIDANQILRELEDTIEFPGIMSQPLDVVRSAFQQRFPDMTGGAGAIHWEGDGSYFQAGFTFLDERTVSMITVCCGYELLKSPKAMQRLYDVAASLGCRVYDPQQI